MAERFIAKGTGSATPPGVPRALAAAALLLAAAAQAQSLDPPAAPGGDGAGAGQSGYAPGVRLISPLAEGEWHLPNGDLANTRYSPLDQITAENVAGLKMTTTFSTGIPRGHEGNPLVVGDTLYITTPYPNILYALDLSREGAPLKWTFQPKPSPQAVGIACCDVVNRGASYGDGKIVYNLLDGHTVAVDAETGKEVWRTRVANTQIGETLTMAPLIAKDKVIVGNSGGELGVRGWVLALDLASGEELWRGYNTGPDSEVLIGADFEPFYAKDRGEDLGATSWQGKQWELGGAPAWGWISYDPGLDLIYYGTGNPAPWNAELRPGDNKWSSSIIARDPDTGQMRWAYQISPNDAWDYDEINENVLVDLEIDGRMRKVLIHPGRTGFMFVLDRETGEVLSAEKYQPVNWAEGFDLETGLPQAVPEKRPTTGKVTRDICPSATGAKEVIPSAFSPRTGLIYVPAHNTCMDYEGLAVANYIAGTPYLGAEVKMYRGPGGYHGELVAWDPRRAEPVWSAKETEFPLYSGVLATAGDVVFYGTMDGWFKAVDARDGKLLWKFKCGSGIVASPMTYLGPDGKQYVAIYAGIGGWMGAVAFPSISTDDPYAALGVVGAMKDIKKVTAPGDVLYVFGL